MEKKTKKNGSAAASGRKVEKKNAGAKAAGTGKAGTGKAETPEAAKAAQAARDPFDFSADLPEWRKLAKEKPHEARAQVATWAALLPVSDDSNVTFCACLDTFASVSYLLEKAGRRIIALEKMSDDAARTFKAELAKVVDAKAAAELSACL